jgi:hypothetical protein
VAKLLPFDAVAAGRHGPAKGEQQVARDGSAPRAAVGVEPGDRELSDRVRWRAMALMPPLVNALLLIGLMRC